MPNVSSIIKCFRFGNLYFILVNCLVSIVKLLPNCRHPDPVCRPLACDLVTKLQRPDFIFLKWQAIETSRYPEEAQTLSTALENGHCLHMDLQRRYCEGPRKHKHNRGERRTEFKHYNYNTSKINTFVVNYTFSIAIIETSMHEDVLREICKHNFRDNSNYCSVRS